MANLTRAYRWERFAPDIGDNLSLPEGQRLELEVASGLTGEQLRAHRDAITGAFESARETPEKLPELLAAALSPVVRLVGSHTVDGKPVTTLAEYLGVVFSLSGVYNLREVTQTVLDFNSIEGTSRLFFARHSGGSPTTSARSAAAPTAGR